MTATLPRLPNMPLKNNGRWITDADARVVIVRGMNMINKLPPYTPSATGFSDDDAQLLADNGFNVVRVGVIYSAVEPAPGTYDDDYLADIKGTVDMLARHGIMSLIDFHQDGWGPAFICEGFPEWATFTDGNPIRPIGPFPGLLANEAVMAAFDNLWNNIPGPGGVGLQDRLGAAWTYAANALKSAEGILGWEILNEPFPAHATSEQLTQFTQTIVKAIRIADTDHMIWYEPWVTFDWGEPTKIGWIDDPAPVRRIGMAFHNYMDVQTEGKYDVVWQNALDHFEATIRPEYAGDGLLLTEFGADVEPGTKGLDIIKAQMKSVDSVMMPAIYWAYWNRTPYQIAQPEGGFLAPLHPAAAPNASAQTPVPSAPMGIVYDPSVSVDENTDLGRANVSWDKLTALTRPYPIFIAGTPIRWNFDPGTFRFELEYMPIITFGNDVTEIFVPFRQYPNGVNVSIDSGEATVVFNANQVVQIQTIGDGRPVVFAMTKKG